jgi:7-cyano-7-deazaguanine synthase
VTREVNPSSTPGIAVLFSAGLDSAVLLAHAIGAAAGGRATGGVVRAPSDIAPYRVQPVYVSAGLAWERYELEKAAQLLASAPYAGRVMPLVTLQVDMRDVYPASHWAVRGEAPAYDTPDEDVYIEGRNIVLLSKAAVYMARARLTHILIGTLGGNPFPDATPEFFSAMATALSLGLAAPVRIEAPFSSMHKADIIRIGRSLGVPFESTLSCMQPDDGGHCGRCSKCRERIDAFREAGGEDPTKYGGPTRR